MGIATQRRPDLPALLAQMQAANGAGPVVVKTLTLLSAMVDRPSLRIGSRALIKFDTFERRGTVMWANDRTSVIAFDAPLAPRDLIGTRKRFDCCPIAEASRKWMLSKR